MPEFSDRPDGLPIHASSGEPASNIRPSRNSLYYYNGYAVNTIISSDDHNGKFQANGFWFGYLDMGGIRNDDWLDSTVIQQISVDSLTYVLGQNPTVFPGADVDTRTTVLFEGTRVETDSELLQTGISTGILGDKLYYPAAAKPGRIWVYLHVPPGGTGTKGVRIVSVAPGVDDLPEPNEQSLVGIDIDGAGIITGHTAPIFQPLAVGLPIAAPVFFDQVTIQDLDVTDTLDVGGSTGIGTLGTDTHDFIGEVTFTGLVDIIGPTEVTGDLDVIGLTTLDQLTAKETTIDTVTALAVALDVTGAGDVTAVKIGGGAHSAISATATGPEPTVIAVSSGAGPTVAAIALGTARAIFAQSDDASNCTMAVDQLGDACAAQITSDGTQPTLEVENRATGVAIRGTSNGATPTLDVLNDSTGPAGLFTNQDLSSPTVTITHNDPAGIALATASFIDTTAGVRSGVGTAVFLPEGATLAGGKVLAISAAGSISLGGGVTIDGDDSTSVTTGGLDLINETNFAHVGEVRFYIGTPAFGLGQLKFDGVALTLGDGLAAPRISRPVGNYVQGEITTAAAIANTGASTMLTMVNTQKAWVVMTAAVRSDTVGENIVISIEANGVPIGITNPIYEPVGIGVSMKYPTMRVQYTAIADAPVTFVARYGAILGNTTASAISIVADHSQ